jgi:toxin HigB-1
VIKSFGDRQTEACSTIGLFANSKALRARQNGSWEMLSAASRLDDLLVPPSNRLEKLRGNLGAFHSIRVNDQWRVIFKWIDGHAHAVRVVDYH